MALWRAYTGETSLDRLIHDQEHFLRALARYAIRFKTCWFMSDEDDVFQEACIWLVDSMWNWEDDRNVDLADYVVYNIGVRLKMYVEAERAKKRHPNANRSRREGIWDEQNSEDGSNSLRESSIDSGIPDIETTIAIRQALKIANENLTDLAKELLIALANNNGNLAGATRDLLERDHIVKRFGSDEKHLKYLLRKKVLPEIFAFLQPIDIMPGT